MDDLEAWDKFIYFDRQQTNHVGGKKIAYAMLNSMNHQTFVKAEFSKKVNGFWVYK